MYPFSCNETALPSITLIEESGSRNVKANTQTELSPTTTIDTVNSIEDQIIVQKAASEIESFSIIGTLGDLLASIGPFSDMIARTYLLAILDNVSSLVGTGRTYNSISLDNVLITEKFAPIIDVSGKTTMGSSLLEANLDGKDLFDLGILLFSIVSGFLPFDQSDEKDECFKALSEGDFEHFWEIQEEKWTIFSGFKQSQHKYREPFRQLIEELLTKKTLTFSEIKAQKWCEVPSQPLDKIEGVIIEILKKKGFDC